MYLLTYYLHSFTAWQPLQALRNTKVRKIMHDGKGLILSYLGWILAGMTPKLLGDKFLERSYTGVKKKWHDARCTNKVERPVM